MEAAKPTPSSEPLSADVWAEQFVENAKQWEVPLVDLERLGIFHDEDGFISSRELTPLVSGAEAHPYRDDVNRVVYKLFFMNLNGSIGKKLAIGNYEGVGYEVESRDGVWSDILDKILILNAAGGHLTEIVGLAESGDYIVAKQPLAYPFERFPEDRDAAEQALRGVKPRGGEGLREHIVITHISGEDWMVGDLHERNIMRDSNNEPTIIDALIGRVPPSARKHLPWLADACVDADIYRQTGSIPNSDICSGVDDSEL